MNKIDLKGCWKFCLDREMVGVEKRYYQGTFDDTILLPATVATAQKVTPSMDRIIGYLTNPYQYEGYTWFQKIVNISKSKAKEYFLILERTRVSHLWVDDTYIGSNNSLCTSHQYRITPYVKEQSKLTIMIDNTSYPVKGGHMTSCDTQTNWNGITGEIYIKEVGKSYFADIKVYPDSIKKQISVKVNLQGSDTSQVVVWVSKEETSFERHIYSMKEGENTFVYSLGDKAKTWSEHFPVLYQLNLELQLENHMISDVEHVSFGLREFKTSEKYFEINGIRTFLRGKHDGLIFPMTGHAPTDLESWLKVLGIAKQYGINHYRFHTCCPPKAAFEAADILGIYMEPELPFWGTVTTPGEEGHEEDGQLYLIEEGFRILDEFGNHPSFVMMSLGNELWGNQERLNQILKGYKQYDSRHLYTQGSNNFQFAPCILENEDFYCGVRFSKDRLFRGSYAMCDAPQGHIQTLAPNLKYNYNQIIRPDTLSKEFIGEGEVTIQYGTGTKTVKVDVAKEMIPYIPVVSHEIGQYAMYPDFTEIDKYTGVLKARYLEEFKERVKVKGLTSMTDHFFRASGRFAAECYKAELETALKSEELAGFQLLDLQDFTGQGTALVGILNSFMENKGVISLKEWQQFCSDAVLLGELEKFTFTSGETMSLGVKFAVFCAESFVNPILKLTIHDGQDLFIIEESYTQKAYFNGVYDLGKFTVTMPDCVSPKKLRIELSLVGTKIDNSYEVWLYPEFAGDINIDKLIKNDTMKVHMMKGSIIVTRNLSKAILSLEQGQKVLYYPDNLDESNSIEGTYCTDFWCYPMFRSISESMGKPVPIGTHGLYIEQNHNIFDYFPTKSYTTAQWYDMISNSRALILDEGDPSPIIWTIDNFERNHKLGNLLELKVNDGKLVICTFRLFELKDSAPASWFQHSILQYMSSDKFQPNTEITAKKLKKIFGE